MLAQCVTGQHAALRGGMTLILKIETDLLDLLAANLPRTIAAAAEACLRPWSYTWPQAAELPLTGPEPLSTDQVKSTALNYH